jgi:bifunctional DNA-binding transcriptional regulator/antitoxin component of YhaV-PrlF toxin-antitoxin module
MSEDFTYGRKPDKLPQMRVSEAAVEYITGRKEDAVSTISSKNQITLPVHLLRRMGVGPGDRLAVALEGGRLILRARPKDWVAHYGGSLPGYWGKNEEEIDAYIRELRDSTHRDELIERAWTGTEPTP